MDTQTNKREGGGQMSLILSERKPVPCGVHHAICTEVTEPEVITTNFGDRPVIRIYWDLDKEREDGKRHRIGRTFTASLHPKSNLGRFLEVWMGKTPTRLKEDTLVGRRAYLVVIHETGRDGNTYAKVDKAMLADGENTLTL